LIDSTANRYASNAVLEASGNDVPEAGVGLLEAQVAEAEDHRGWAILKTDSRSESIEIATEFMELHRKHWPGFEGESELRPIFDPGTGP
jgi:hypothetical protein